MNIYCTSDGHQVARDQRPETDNVGGFFLRGVGEECEVILISA